MEAILALRRLRFTAAEIAETLAMALSTVSGILTRLGYGRLGRLGADHLDDERLSRQDRLLRLCRLRLGCRGLLHRRLGLSSSLTAAGNRA